MRKRFNRNAVCSSENYSASRKSHLGLLKEQHDHFCGMVVSGEIKIDVPQVSNNKKASGNNLRGFQPKFKTVRIFGKEMRLTIEEYETHYLNCKF